MAPEATAKLARATAPIVVLVLACVVCIDAHAATVTVTVRDREGLPIPDVAVYVQPADGTRTTASPGTTAVMDQYDTRFVPHLLVVQTGTSVEFPNSDSVAHHVYSFSHPNHFKLPIYKGDVHPPVTFAESGIVILGCNIHDNMLGYILVVDTDRFTKTDENGVATFRIDDLGAVAVAAWSPRFRDAPESMQTTIDIANDTEARVTIQAAKSLRPPHDDQTEVLTWSDY